MNDEFQFVHDERLGIDLPVLDREWWEYEEAARAAMVAQWELIRARIPDRVKELEEVIIAHQLDVSQEDDWDRVCELYEEIYAIASVINDLNIWNKIEPDVALSTDEAEGGLSDEHTNREK